MDAGEKADGIANQLIALTKKALADLKKANEGEKTENAAEKGTSPVTEQVEKVAEKPLAASEKIDMEETINVFQAILLYQDDCEMENIRAYTALNNLKDYIGEEHHYPENILEDDQSVAVIRQQGFNICFTTSMDYAAVSELLNKTIFLKELRLQQLSDVKEWSHWPKETAPVPVAEKQLTDAVPETKNAKKAEVKESNHQSMISVNVGKLDVLMDLVGELVIAEAMVTQNPDIQGLELENFNKAARQLKKISGELQDGVMAIRMVPLTGTFQKMNRIVRDMSQKLNKKS